MSITIDSECLIIVVSTFVKAFPVNKSEVRMMVNDFGYIETSKRLNIPAPTLRQWAKRGKWNVPTRTDQRVTLVTQAPADAHAAQLAEDEAETRASLSRAARQMAKDCEKLPVRHSDKALNVGKLTGIVHKWDAKQQQGANVMVNIALLGIDPESVSVKGDIIDQA